MLEIIGVGSLALAMNMFPTTLNDLQHDLNLGQSVESRQLVEPNHELSQGYLAKGKPQESRYRQEADRDSEWHEDDRYDNSDHAHPDEEDSRIEDYQQRTERDAQQRRDEINYSKTSERRDRDDYEPDERYRRHRDDYEIERREAEYERERAREERRESLEGISIFDLLRTGEY